MKINNVWDDLTDVSAKKEALRLTWVRHFCKFDTEGREIEIQDERSVERGFGWSVFTVFQLFNIGQGPPLFLRHSEVLLVIHLPGNHSFLPHDCPCVPRRLAATTCAAVSLLPLKTTYILGILQSDIFVYTVGPLIIESLLTKPGVSTGALGAPDNPLAISQFERAVAFL